MRSATRLGRCMHCSLACDLAVSVGPKGAVAPDYAPAEGSATRGRLCFRGHYACALIGHPARLSDAWIRNGAIRRTSLADGLGQAALKLRDAVRARSLAVLIDGTFPCEETAKAVSFARECLRCPTVAVYVPPADEGLLRGLGNQGTATLERLAHATTILAVGDVFSTHPVVAGLILDAISRTRQGRLLAIDSTVGRTMRFAAKGYLVRPGTEAAALAAIARSAGATLDGFPDPEEAPARLAQRAGLDEGAIREIVSQLRATPESVVALSVPAGRASSPAACGAALAAIARSGIARVMALCASGNARGALAVGKAFGALPLGSWLTQLSARPAMVVLCIGTDLLGCAPGELTETVFGSAETVIAAASMPSATTARADIILPLAGWFETSGTLLSAVGEPIALGALSDPPGGALAPGDLARELAQRVDGSNWRTPELDVSRLDWSRTCGTAPAGLEIGDSPLPNGGFTMVSRTEHYELPEAGVSRQLDWVRLMEPEPAAQLAPADAERLGVRAGDKVRLSGASGAADVPVGVTDALPLGVLAAPAGLGSTRDLFPWNVRANGLVEIGPAVARIEAVQSAERAKDDPS